MFKFAKWIWFEKESHESSFGEFFGEFDSTAHPTCKISCDGDYTLFVNGKYASSNQYGDFEHYKSVDEIDLTPFVNAGKNKIAILVWHFGRNSQRYKKYAPGVIAEIYDGDKVLFATDENTLARKSNAYESGFCRVISSQLGFSYSYDSTKEDAWLTGDGENMKKAHPVDKKADFVPRPNKKLSLGSLVPAKEIGCRVYDLGREYVGLLSFTIVCKDKTKINVAYGEHLENGQVKKQIHDRNFSIDYIAKPGKNSYTNYMLRFACRYLQIFGEGEFDVEEIGIIPQFYPVKEKPTALTGLDYEIYQACVNTLQLCMMEHYVDCPWREQCLYAFDSRNQMLSGYYAFEGGNLDYVKSNLILMSKDRRKDGLLSICYPCGVDLTIPSFSLYYLVSVLEYITYSKDTKIIENVNDKLTEILNTFMCNSKNGLICKFEGNNHWNFYDWSPYADGALGSSEAGEPDAMINILTVYALKCYKKICELCTLPFAFDKKIDELTANIRSEFFSLENRVFLTEKNGHATELVNSLAIVGGLASTQEAEHICSLLAKGELVPSSLSMKCFLYDALISTDKERYKSFILDHIRKTYAPMASIGTVWETVDGASAFDGAGSLCHGWSSTPIYYYSILNS